jgi:hypothetical protein
VIDGNGFRSGALGEVLIPQPLNRAIGAKNPAIRIIAPKSREGPDNKNAAHMDNLTIFSPKVRISKPNEPNVIAAAGPEDQDSVGSF